jgi:hypothetical protein
MGCRRRAGWLGAIGGWLAAASAFAQPAGETAAPGPEPHSAASAVPSFPAARVPLEELHPAIRERVRKVLEHPTLSARGPAEGFCCSPLLYYWLVEHPDQASRLWRGLGAQCTHIANDGGGRFSWQDPQAGEIHWETVLRGPHMRVWFAEGEVKPAPLLPSSKVQAVLVLHYVEGHDGEGKPALRHQMDLVLHTDSRALALAARLFGVAAPRAAEQYIAQMEMFFGALAWYLTEHPAKARALFEQMQRPTGTGAATPPPPPGNG